jgi:glutathione peroxidase-family protein
LRILGFPSNDFGSRNPDRLSDRRLLKNYGVEFDVFKITVLGNGQSPLYKTDLHSGIHRKHLLEF